jgi:DNA-binding transcriptional regulator YdaS (Cro superfamily)
MTTQQAADLAGSKAALARLLGVTRGAVSQWVRLPKGRLYQLMVLRPEWFDKV